MSTPFPAIPYGRGHFKGLRLDGCLYVDKTRFLHALERERYVFLIRPRRFGKTCWLGSARRAPTGVGNLAGDRCRRRLRRGREIPRTRPSGSAIILRSRRAEPKA